MNKHALLMTLAILTILVPVLGFPGSWKSFFIIVLGIAIGYISYRLYREDLRKTTKTDSHSGGAAFVDNLHT